MDADRKQTWELLIYNSNHMNLGPHCLLKTVSYELADHLMNSLHNMFVVNQYKSFKMMIRCLESGAIIRDERSL